MKKAVKWSIGIILLDIIALISVHFYKEHLKEKAILAEQEEIITKSLPRMLYLDKVASSANSYLNDFQEGLHDYLVNVITRYADDANRRYQKEVAEVESLFNISIDEYNRGARSPLNFFGFREVTNNSRSITDAYQDNSIKIFEGFQACLQNIFDSLSRCDNYDKWIQKPDINEAGRFLFGTPGNMKKYSEKNISKTAEDAIGYVFHKTDFPTINSIIYNKKRKYWTVRFDNDKTQYVTFYLKTDGTSGFEHSEEEPTAEL